MNTVELKKFKNKYRIESARLKDYDYSSDGLYFVTICIDDRKCHFGFIRNYQMYLSKLGEIAIKFWKEIPAHFPFVILDLFVIMPNHIHGILIIDKEYKIEGHTENKNLNQIDENRRDEAMPRLYQSPRLYSYNLTLNNFSV